MTVLAIRNLTLRIAGRALLDGADFATDCAVVAATPGELADLLLAAVPRLQGRLDVGEQRVQRRSHLADLRALVGQVLGHPLGQVDLASGQRQRRHVVGERPEQIALDGAQGATGQPDRVHRRPQVTADQGQVGGLDRHVGTGAHRNAQVGLRQRGGVVHPVTDHRDDAPGVLEAPDLGELVLGQHAGRDVLRVDADLLGHHGRRVLVVAGQQVWRQPELLEPGHGGGAALARAVGDGDRGVGGALPADEDGGARRGLQRRSELLRHPVEELGLAHADLGVLDAGPDAPAGPGQQVTRATLTEKLAAAVRYRDM